MDYSCFEKLANTYGFARVYFTAPMSFDFMPENKYNLIMDAKKELSFASCIAILVYPYAQFDLLEHIPAYYIASNASYHSCKRLISELVREGIRAEKVEIPIKPQLLRSGVGTQCRSSLVSIPGLGTRVVLHAVAIDMLEPISYDEKDYECGFCTECISACPVTAIGENGLSSDRCMRFAMESAEHPDWVKAQQMTYIGCEICQYACPRNHKTDSIKPNCSLLNAFDTARLIAGDTSDARKLIGRNMTSQGRLTAEAIAMAVRDEPDFFSKYSNELLKAENSEFHAVQDALRYVKELYGR